jgi:Lipocalin-like domain
MNQLWASGTRLCFALGASLLCFQQPPARDNVRSLLVGTWKLVSTEERLRNGGTRPYPDLGAAASGYLLYGADGHMCAALMNPARPAWSHDQEHPTDAEKIGAGSGFTAYCGTYQVDEKRRVIVHYPEVSFYPNAIGTAQKRPYRLEGSRLTFSGAEDAGEVERWTIVWEKVGGPDGASGLPGTTTVR